MAESIVYCEQQVFISFDHVDHLEALEMFVSNMKQWAL